MATSLGSIFTETQLILGLLALWALIYILEVDMLYQKMNTTLMWLSLQCALLLSMPLGTLASSGALQRLQKACRKG